MIREEITSAAAGQMAKHLDVRIKAALDAFWPPGWTLDDVKARCRLVSLIGSDVQTLYADDVPLLEVYPIQLESERTTDGWTMRLTQQYRTLRRGV